MDISILNKEEYDKPVRDGNGKWQNVVPFIRPRLHFEQFGVYTKYVTDTNEWIEFWTKEREKCMFGMEHKGVRITGNHYFYLNYTQVSKIDTTKKTKLQTKYKGFPDFWDGDYNYFWVLDIAKNGCTLQEYKDLDLFVSIPEDDLCGGLHVIVGKARRKGYSYKNSAVVLNRYLTTPNSLSIIAASDNKYLYPTGTMGMFSHHLSFVSEHTAWIYPRDVIDKVDHKRASYYQTRDGVKIESGFKSEVMAITFNDNPDAGRGKDPQLVLWEEAGAFKKLKESYNSLRPTMQDGIYTVGQMIVFGTSGDIDGSSKDFINMFYNPRAYGAIAFNNKWDSRSEDQLVGFFHPMQWNMVGCYDEFGNSDLKASIKIEQDRRNKILKDGGDSSQIASCMQENPLTPAEAFLSFETNTFPVAELREQLIKVKSKSLHLTLGTCVNLVQHKDNGMVEAVPIMGKDNRRTSINDKLLNNGGEVVIYEPPIPNCEKGLYKIGYDPVRQDTGTSLACCLVYKSRVVGENSHCTIVAEFLGRRKTVDDNNRIVELLCQYYNSTVMYENEVPSVKTYFQRRNKLQLLEKQPDGVISKSTRGTSGVRRLYGCHMNTGLKDAGEQYITQELLKVDNYDENGQPINKIKSIYSIPLLEELIRYERKGNYDTVMALMMIVLQINNEDINKEYSLNVKKSVTTDLLSIYNLSKEV